MPVQQPKISFVVPVRNDAVRLSRCLASIRANFSASDSVDIVVADNGSMDQSVAVARDSGATVLCLPDVRLGALRNAAAKAATGDVLAFVDADHEIDPQWVATALSIMADRQVAGAGAAYSTPEPATWVQRTYDLLRSHPAGRVVVDWLGSGNLAVRREAFVAIGGFDVFLETCEDVDLCRKLRTKGLLVSDDRLKSVHHGDPRSLRQVFFGELWRGRDNVRVSLRPPLSPRMLVSAALPAFNLVAILGLAIGLPLLVQQAPAVAGLCAAWLGAQLALRTVMMIRRSGSNWLAASPRALAVGGAYELGRALALLGRFSYGRRRPVARASST